MKATEVFCPAKVNLFLAVTGRRADGYHEIVSLMAPLSVGDRLRLEWQGEAQVRFFCDDDRLPQNEENLVVRAISAFRERFPFSQGLRVELKKAIPAGAGLGGGSSDAAGALVGLNRLLGEPADWEQLHALAASVGSDCPFFLDPAPAIVRGRGERTERAPETVRQRLRGTRLLLMKPSFPVSTAWAYGALSRDAAGYLPRAAAEERLERWLRTEAAPVRELLFNSLERPVFRKFIPLSALKERLERELDLPVLMSGSGSTLFALIGEGEKVEPARERARDALGEDGWIAEVRIFCDREESG